MSSHTAGEWQPGLKPGLVGTKALLYHTLPLLALRPWPEGALRWSGEVPSGRQGRVARAPFPEGREQTEWAGVGSGHGLCQSSLTRQRSSCPSFRGPVGERFPLALPRRGLGA